MGDIDENIVHKQSQKAKAMTMQGATTMAGDQ
jgi:hypothetical protein